MALGLVLAAPDVPWAQAQPIPAGALEVLDKRFDSLAFRTRNLETMQTTYLEETRDFLSHVEWLFGIMTAILTIFFSVTTGLQFWKELKLGSEKKSDDERYRALVDKYESSLNRLGEVHEKELQGLEGKFFGHLQDQEKRSADILAKTEARMDKYQESQERKNQELMVNNKDLIESARKNINQITQLLASLDHLFLFREEAKKRMDELQQSHSELERLNKEEQQKRQKDLERTARDLNEEAMNICILLTRENYKSPENQQLFLDFCDKLRSKELDPEHLNANCHLILGLDFNVRRLFDKALKSIQEASLKARHYARNAPGPNLYPKKDSEKAMGWNRKLANICAFHEGTIRQNLGDFQEAERLFREAVDYDETDVDSMICIPEAKRLAGKDDSETIIKTFEQVPEKIKGVINTVHWKKSRDALLSELYVQFGNFFYPWKDDRSKYLSKGNLKEAEGNYRKAHELDPSSYLARFSYAQTLLLKLRFISAEERHSVLQTAQRLLKEVHQVVKIKVGEATENRSIMMHNFMLAICCKESPIPGEFAGNYTRLVYEFGGKLAANDRLLIFSPLSKRALTYGDLKQELQEFEETVGASALPTQLKGELHANHSR